MKKTDNRQIAANGSWKAFTSSVWSYFHWFALIAALVSIGLIVYGGLVVSQIWMLAPLIGLIFIPLSVIARTWGWTIIFALIFLFFPVAIALQGINW